MSVANQANTRLAFEAQSALGSAASGAGATGLEVMRSRGLSMQIATIESQIIQRNRLRKRARQGSRSVVANYETELQVAALDPILQAVVGGSWTAEASYSNTDWGDCTITGTGVTLTFSTGTLITDGVRAGMFIKFTNLSVAGNNSKWVPIVSLTETVLTVVSGILADNALDASWNAVIARNVYTAEPYTDRYFTVEEYLTDIDRSKVGTDMKFHSLSFDASPDSYVRCGFGLMGIDLAMLATGSSPTFSSPTFVDNPSLTLLDGGIYVNGTLRSKLTGFRFGNVAPGSTIPVLGTTSSPDVLVGSFSLDGNFQAVVEDATDWDLFDAETQISVIAHCAEQGGAASDFIGFYLGNLAFGGWETDVGGEGALIASVPLYGGEDERGATSGYAPSQVMISTSAA